MGIAIKAVMLISLVFSSAFMAQLGCPINDPPQVVLTNFYEAIEDGDYETNWKAALDEYQRVRDD